MVADGRTCFAWCNCKPFLNVSLNFSGHVIMCMDDDALHLQGQPDREGGRKEGGPDSRRSNGRTGQLFGYVPSTPCANCIVRISMQQLAMVSIPTNMHGRSCSKNPALRQKEEKKCNSHSSSIKQFQPN